MEFFKRTKLFSVLASETWRRILLRWKSGPYSGLSLPISTLPSQTFFPMDIRPVDPELASDYYRGRYVFGDHVLELEGDTPFAVDVSHADWAHELHGFRWLRHLSASGSDLSKAQGVAMIADWIHHSDRPSNSHAFEPMVMADRIIAWSCHATGLMIDAGSARRHDMRRSLAQQVKLLQSLHSSLPVDCVRLKSAMAVTYVALCFGAREKALRSTQRELVREIDRQILADGGHISRNPAVLVDILADMWPLLDVFTRSGITPASSLVSAVDRILGALRFFRHSDGTLAQFNGTGIPSKDLLANLLNETVSTSQLPITQIQQSAPATGYERLSGGATVLLMDTGTPLSPASAGCAAAGCLSFELSSGKHRFVVNVGKPVVDAKRLAPFWRVTAAHSTANIGDQSSARFAKNARLANALPAPMLSWPESVTCDRREVDGMLEIDASHDGYVKEFGLIHRRIVQLSKDGKTLNGADRFEKVDPQMPMKNGEELVLRFHLPPNISASLLSNGHSILLAAPDREAWTFTCVDAPISLTESIHFADLNGPRKSEQIVVRAQSNRHAELRWNFERRSRKTPNKAKSKAKELPDLLTHLQDIEPAE